MSLLNRLRPKWQNSDPDVRASAVRSLDKDEVELLTAVAQGDEDARVRRIAIKKIDAPRSLLEIAEGEADESNRDFALQRAGQILVQIATDDRDLEESKRALELLKASEQIIQVADRARFDEIKDLAFQTILEDQDSLGELIKRAQSPGLRERAFEHVQATTVLRTLALEGTLGSIALSAVDRLDDIEILESIHSSQAASKSVRRRARGRLEDLIDDDHPIRVAERNEIFERLTRQASEIMDSLTPDANLWTSIQHDWLETSKRGEPSETLTKSFEDLRSRLNARLDKTSSPEPTNDSPAKVESEPPDASNESPAADPNSSPPEGSPPVGATEDAPSSSSEPALTASSPLDEVPSEAEPSETTTSEAPHEAISMEEAISTANELTQSAESLLEAEDEALSKAISGYRRLQSAWKKLEASVRRDSAEASSQEPLGSSWSELVSKFQTVGETLTQKRQQHQDAQRQLEQNNLKTLDTHCAKIERFLQADSLSLKKASDELRLAQDFLKDMGPLPAGVSRKKQRQRLRDLRETLFRRVQEARENDDWKRWANADIQTALIKELETLKQGRDYPKIAKEMRDIHDRWRKAGTAPPDKAEKLWAQYKELRAELDARCHEFFKKQDAERGGNLEKKEALCVQAESLKDSEEWNKTANALRELQAEWKKIGPVPQKKSDAIWQRFRGACNEFFEKRKSALDSKMTGYKENLSKKVALCEQAEALKESTDWRDTADALKKLQSEWKAVGPVPRKKSDAVWNRFRGACDYFFDRFKRRDEIGLEVNVEQAEEILSKLAAVEDEAFASAEPNDAGTFVVEQWAAWKTLGQLPSNKTAELWKRLRETVTPWLDKAGDATSLKKTDLDPILARKKLEKLCQRAEKLADEYESGPDAASDAGDLDDLAARLKNALASNTIAGSSRKTLDWKEGATQIQRLKNTFERSVPLREDARHSLAERLDKAYARFENARKSASSTKKQKA